MTAASIADRLAAGEPLVAGWSSLPEPLVAEACVRVGFSAVLLDMQHGLVDLASAFRMISGIRHAGGRAIVRIPVGEYQTASRLLDAGADMIVAPMIETAADAATFASFVKYPPLGSRSWGPSRAVQIAGIEPESYRLEANRQTLAVAMIETRRALAAIDEILALPGIDGLFVGPADLSIALTDGARLDVSAPETLEACAHVVARARAAGKFAGIYCADPDYANRALAMGFRFVTLMSDVAYLTAGAKAALSGILRPNAADGGGSPAAY